MNYALVIIGFMLSGICCAETGPYSVVSASETTKFPSFLPKYYEQILTVNNQRLFVVNQRITNGVVVVDFSTESKSLKLTLTHIECNHPQQRLVFGNIVGNLNRTITTNCGRFIKITETDLTADVTDADSVFHRIYAFILPRSVQIWDFEISPPDNPQIKLLVESETGRIFPLVNKQRYNEALDEGNVSMGRWGDQIHDYAMWLVEKGEKKQALDVLRKHLVASPFDYEAHGDLLSLTDDSSEAVNHAGIVFKKAENQDLIEKAAVVLGTKMITLNDFPKLESGEAGLQLILVPLPPCNPWILKSAGDMFAQITDIPVKICRMENEWIWGGADRIYGERDVQEILAKTKGHAVDFAGWAKERYVSEMKNSAQTFDAVTKYYVAEWVNKIEKNPGQYRVDSHLDRFCDMLDQVRSADVRTMYVGITEANIFSGDNRYLFSLGREKGSSRASIFSYYMMRADVFDGVPSRQRLIERIGKELVPAALKQLGIPRSTDPDCPYSYANGVERLDQKTLILSNSVKDELMRLKNSSSLLSGIKIEPSR